MTAIAAIASGGKVWIGGDAAGVGGLSISVRSDPKVFINGEFIIGYTTSFRMGQLLQYEFSPPTPYENESGMAYMVKRFVPAIQRCFHDGGWEIRDDGQRRGGTFIVGWRGRLYEIESDYQVAQVAQPYIACGCGFDLALGALFATERTAISPEDRIKLALEAAQQFSAGVRGPFTVVSL